MTGLTIDAGVILTGLIAYTGVCAWLFRVQSVAIVARDGVKRIDEERKVDKDAYNRRLEKAEEFASNLKALAENVEGLKDLMEQEARHQAQRHNDLKSEIQHARNNAAQAKELASRGRGRRGGDDTE